MVSLVSVAEQTNTRLCRRLLQDFGSIAVVDDDGMTVLPRSNDAGAIARRLSYEENATLRLFDQSDLRQGEIQISIEDDDWVYAEGDGQHEAVEHILIEILGD
jgi:hypothetical protein